MIYVSDGIGKTLEGEVDLLIGLKVSRPFVVVSLYSNSINAISCSSLLSCGLVGVGPEL